MTTYALLIIALVLSVAKAKQMFLNRHTNPGTASFSRPVTIQVVPFQGISGSSEDANVAFNITEELTEDCRRSRFLRVIARNEGAIAGVDNPVHAEQAVHSDKLLRGTAGREGNKIQITVQLIDAVSGASIWSKTFEQSGADVLQTEQDIASRITSDLQNSLRAGA